MKSEISIAKPGEIEMIWGDVYPHLKPAIEEDLFTDEDILKEMLLKDEALMFVALVDGVIEGAAVTVIEDVRCKVLNIVTIGGNDFKYWKKQMNDALTLYGKSMGCRIITALGRDAWERIWPDFEAGKRLYTKRIAA